MRFGFFCDLHLDHNPFPIPDWQMLDLQLEQFKRQLAIFMKEKCDALVFPGDTFDTPNPSLYAMSGLMDALPADKPCIFILGNHEIEAYRRNEPKQHALMVFKSIARFNPNIKIITKPRAININGIDIALLPYPHLEIPESLNGKRCLTVFHKEFAGTYRDNGTLETHGEKFSIKEMRSAKQLWVSGHLHSTQMHLKEPASDDMRVSGGLIYPGRWGASAHNEGLFDSFVIIDVLNKEPFYRIRTFKNQPFWRLQSIRPKTEKEFLELIKFEGVSSFIVKKDSKFIPDERLLAQFKNVTVERKSVAKKAKEMVSLEDRNYSDIETFSKSYIARSIKGLNPMDYGRFQKIRKHING